MTLIDRLQLCGPLKNSETILNVTINANLIVYISVSINDFIHNYHRTLFNDIPGNHKKMVVLVEMNMLHCNGSPLLPDYLSCLFACVLSHCFIPTSFSVSTMVPIPKGSNKELTNIKNYRGIALSSLISMLFDNCIMSLNSYIYLNPMIFNLFIRRKRLMYNVFLL